MLHDSDLPKFLWGEASQHAVYLKNRTWTRTLGDTTPFENLTGKKPDLSTIHPWGCRVRVHDTVDLNSMDVRRLEDGWVLMMKRVMDIVFTGLRSVRSLLKGALSSILPMK